MRKRSATENPDAREEKRRKDENIFLTSDFPSGVEASLLVLKNRFYDSKMKETSLPPVFFVHQIYAVVKNKTKVDREVAVLQSKSKIILFKLRGDEDDVAVTLAFTDDITDHISKHSSLRTVKHFTDNILPLIKDVSIDKQTLKNKFSLSENNINELIQNNLLVIQDIGSFWLSFPRAGEFTATYNLGRKCFLRMIAKSKYSEILESELLKRKLPKKAVLSTEYHILDLIGSEAVKCIPTTSGTLLRLVQR